MTGEADNFDRLGIASTTETIWEFSHQHLAVAKSSSGKVVEACKHLACDPAAT